MSQLCSRCYKTVARACQSDTETADCASLRRVQKVAPELLASLIDITEQIVHGSHAPNRAQIMRAEAVIQSAQDPKK